MSAQQWNEQTSQPIAIDGQRKAAWDDDAVLDAFLASLTVPQFDTIMNFLMDEVYPMESMLDRPVA